MKRIRTDDAPDPRAAEQAADEAIPGGKSAHIGCSSQQWREITPGLVLLPGFLTSEEQFELADLCLPMVQNTPICKNEVTKNMKQVTIGEQRTAKGGKSTALPDLVAKHAENACSAACIMSDSLTMLHPRTC